ncbi:MAG: hypothetical protein DRQ10_01205 [Candidatus Hydrothermota bacterium]|nr:MAG: hypothetical protein DRQ10_01205 [Candidatus Hydrothermae bacterium]
MGKNDERRRILIVEDDANLMQILSDIFVQAGFEVEVASNAYEAIEKLEKGFGPDIVLSDILMPEMDGFELFKKVRTMPYPSCQNVPFVFLTALSDQANRLRGLGMGADDYITKPFDPQELVIRIQNILRRREAVRMTLSGSLREVPLIDILQLLETQRKTGVLRIDRRDKVAEIFLKNGRVVHVNAGDLIGKEALKAILRWDSGEFEFVPNVQPQNETMDENTTELILNCMSELDEERASEATSSFSEKELEAALSILREAEKQIDVESPVEIGHNTFWIGQREKENVELQVNVYLRRFIGEGKTVNLLIESGPIKAFDSIASKCVELIESMSNIDMCAVTQPLPDMCSNIVRVVELNEDITILSTFENLRAIYKLDIPRDHFKPVDFLRDYTVNLPTGHKLVFIPMKFLPLRGSIGIFDPENKILFSSFLMSGFVTPGDIQLFATEADWDGIKKFAKFYFPTKKALIEAINAVNRATQGDIELIAPAYGKLVRGSLISEFWSRLADVDLLFES